MIDSITINAVAGFLAALFAILSFFSARQIQKNTDRRNDFIAVHQYMKALEQRSFIDARAHVYKLAESGQPLTKEDKNASLIVNFYHHWGLLAQKGYLPMWVFEEAGHGMVRMYEMTETYIETLRKLHHDNTYGCYFEWLYKQIVRKNPSI